MYDLRSDFITKKEIRKFFPNETYYQIDKLFREVRVHSKQIGLNMFSRFTVPTKLFCDYWSIDFETFMEIITKEET